MPTAYALVVRSRLRNNRKFGGVPGGESARHLDQIGNAILVQNADGNRGTVSPRAVHSDTAATRNFREALLHVVEGNIQAFRYMFGFPLAGIPDIQDEGRIAAPNSSAIVAALTRSVGQTRSGRSASAAIPPSR